MLACHRFLPKDLRIIGYARSKLTDESLREKLQGHLKGDGVTDFLSRVTYIPGSYDGDEGFQVLPLHVSVASVSGHAWACPTAACACGMMEVREVHPALAGAQVQCFWAVLRAGPAEGAGAAGAGARQLAHRAPVLPGAPSFRLPSGAHAAHFPALLVSTSYLAGAAWSALHA